MDIDDKGNFPLKVRPVTEKERAEVKNKKGTLKLLDNLIRVGPHGYLLWDKYKDNIQQILNLKLRSDDIFVVSFPKSGTSWTQELVWLIANDFDYGTATSIPLMQRFPYLGYESFDYIVTKEFIKRASEADNQHKVAAKLMSQRNDSVDKLAHLPSPRFFKTHLPFSLLPPSILDETRVVFVARDPRDVAVSFFYYWRNMRIIDLQVEFKDFWRSLFKNNLVIYAPYFAHLREAWKLKDHPNMLFLFYEELSKDMPNVIRRVAKFLGKPAVTEEQVFGLCEHLKFDNFKKNKMVNFDIQKQLGIYLKDEHFVRKGKVGGWRDYFDEEMDKEAELWMEEGLRDIDLKFKN